MDPESERQKWLTFDVAIGGLRALLYVSTGIAILMGPSGPFKIQTKYALIIGILLIAYGLYRGFRVFQKPSEK